MKKYTYCFLITLILVSASSCKKILNKEPLDFLDPSAYYNTAEKLESNLAGVYDVLGHFGLYSQWMLYRMGLEADEGYYARTTPVNGPQVYDFTSGDADIIRHWERVYFGIGRANALLANIDNNPSIDINVRTRIRGEALFLRGYYYFMLVQCYGGVPLVTAPITDVDNVDVPRATAKEVYDQILIDMKQAEEMVADIRTLGFGGRVSKSAVRGILARVCLYMAGNPVKDVSKYEEARMWAKKVIDDQESNHSLIPKFSQIFINYAQDKYDINESIWEVEFHGNGSDAFTEAGGVGYVNGPRTTNTTIGYSVDGLRATYKLYTAYEPGDLRRDWTIADFTYNNTTGAKTYITAVGPADLYTRNSAKYRREFELSSPKATSVTPINFALLRYSDILLMFAEADNEVTGAPSIEAIESVNKVRRRAWSTGIKSVQITNGGSGYTSAPIVTFTGGGGTGVTATTTILGGKVTGVTFAMDPIIGTAMGEGYTSIPTITFTGGGGSGATATAVIYKKEDAELSDPQTLFKDDFRTMIQNERLRELSFETFRKFDLIRWGLLIFEMKAVGNHLMQYVPTAHYLPRYRDIWERHLLWPIPAEEMTLNKALVQNPNW